MKQMVLNFLIFLIIVGAIYSLAYPDNRIAATTSAIRDIWSGGCRLSCQSGSSGLSGQAQCKYQGCCTQNKSHGLAGPSSGCVCESCPCALIESVLRNCRSLSASTMYSGAVDLIANCYYTVIETLSEIYMFVDRMLSYRTTCHRPPQLIRRRDSSSENIYFGNKNFKDLDKTRDKTRTSDAGLKPNRSIVLRSTSDTKIRETDAVDSNKAANKTDPKTGTADALKPKEEKEEDSGQSNSCPKCVEQGKVCMKNCPNANVKKK